MYYCDLYVNLNKQNYREMLDYLAEQGYRCIGYPINGLKKELVKDIEKYADNLNLLLLKRSILRKRFRIKSGILYAIDINYIELRNLNKILKITSIIHIPDVETVNVKMLKRLIKIKKLIFEINYVNLLTSIYNRYINRKTLPGVINYLKFLIMESRLMISSGASSKEQILSPKEAIMSILGLFDIHQYMDNFIRTIPYNIVSKYVQLV